MAATIGAAASPDTVAPLRQRIGAPGRTSAAVLGILLVAILCVISCFVGSGAMSLTDSWAALRGTGSESNLLIVRDYRIPRTILAVLVGAGLGAAGARIQAMPRHPLADPGILGVNAGAYLFVTLGAGLLGISTTFGQVWCAMLGALLISVAVFLIGTTGRQGGNPVHLVLTGVALGAVLTGMSSSITLLNPQVFDKVRYWSAGSLQGRQMDVVQGVLPFIILGLLIALGLARQLNSLALGEDLARSLGVHVAWIRALGFVAITLLCGAATAAAGPLSFIGLMVPHAVRSVVGPDQRWVIPVSVISAPALVLSADIVGRILLGNELPAGVVVAFVGAPVLIWLVRRSEAKTL
ncbi:MAG: iron chelate uptake ABC transporter family permease subunit [Yaniella sp.]|nr:iron chelate uptake ABC transporter family permease subunit [Yaniella sp.]